jgi:hypothetical protein
MPPLRAAPPPDDPGRGWAAWLLLLPILAALGLGIALAAGAVAGGSYVHQGSASNAAVFSGGAVTAAQKHAADIVVNCGRSTGTIDGISYSTGPFIVHSVKLTPRFSADPVAAAKLLESCLIGAFAPDGAAVQLCTIQAQHQPGLTQFTAGPYTEAVVICAGESS